MSEFVKFAEKVHQQFSKMSEQELYVVDVDGDTLYQHYLESFPEGTNPILISRTSHDCSTCKNFIRNLGNVVAIKDNKLVSVWNLTDVPFPYDQVAQKLNDLIISSTITKVFRTKESKYGNQTTYNLGENNEVKRWNHFYGTVNRRHKTNSVGEAVGAIDSAMGVFKRGLEELSMSAFDTVIELIENNSIYRGQEHLKSIREFSKVKRQYEKLDAAQKNIFVWENINNPAARFRNTVIGTLVTDLSDGVDLEKAVRSFESKVAPTNYKRPTALITPSMVKEAMKTIQQLDLESALDRRFARMSDITINNVLWADSSAKSLMKSSVESALMEATVKYTVSKEKATKIAIDDFVKNILPTASSMEMFVSGQHFNKFVSITAPAHENSGKLFKWNNDFGWSYDGNITDSIKERVKKAGGNVSADLRVSLSWFNYDDLDLHAEEPGGNHIYFGNKRGILDVDMNAGGGHSREPVENLAWNTPRDGKYKIWVNQFSKRETSGIGFVIEIENNGSVSQYSFNKSVTGNVNVGTLTVKKGVIVEFDISKSLTGGGISQEKWGISSEKFVKVQTLMNSPNYWDDNEIGNKHWFFILGGCKNDAPTRGIYNEFLNSNLEKHRKVFEVLGDRTKCQPADDQLSGIGFSSTQQSSATVRVKTNTRQQTFEICF